MTKSKEKRSKQGSSVFEKLTSHKHASKAFVFLLCLVVYSASVFNDYNLDDELVTKNHPLTSQGIKAIPEIFRSPYYSDAMGYAYDFRPVVHLSFAVEHQVFGEHTKVSHIINVVLYGLLGVMLLMLLHEAFGFSILTALLITVSFVLFPLHSEVVCSIKNRDEILSLLFAIIAVYTSRNILTRSQWWVLPSVAALSFSLLSKYSAVTFAFIIPTVFLFLWNGPLLRAVLVSAVYSIPVFLLHQQPSIEAKLKFTLLVSVTPYIIRVPYLLLLKHLVIRATNFVSKATERASNGFRIVLITIRDNYQFNLITFLIFILFQSAVLAFLLVAVGKYGLMAGIVAVTVFIVTLNKPIVTASGTTTLAFCGMLFFRLMPSIGTDNPFPIIINLMLLLQILPIVGFKKNVPQNLFFLVLICANTTLQFYFINDIGSLFPLIALLGFFLHYLEISKGRLVALIILFCLSLVQSIVMLTTSIELFLWPTFLFETITLVVILLSTFVLLGKVYIINTTKALAMLFAATSLFFISYFPFSIDVSKFTTISIVRLGHINEIQTKNTAPANNEKSILKENFEVFEINSDRQINYVESPVNLYDSIQTRVASAATVMLSYFQKMFVPYPMAFYYGYKEFEPEELTSLKSILGLLVHAMLILLLLYLLVTKQHLGAIGLLIYLVSVFAVSGFMQPIAGVFADRFALIPSLGFCIFWVWCLFNIFKISTTDNNVNWTNLKPTVKYFLLTAFCLYGCLSFSRSLDWKDDLTLMRKDINVVNKSAQAHNLLAIHLVNAAFANTNEEQQKLLREEALYHLKAAQEIYPPFFNVSYDIGRLYLLLNKPDSALLAFQHTIKLDSSFSDCHLNAGEILYEMKRYKEAVPYFSYVIKDRPNEYLGYDKLSFLYFKMGLVDSSIAINKVALKMVTGIVDPYVNIARTFIAAGNNDSALYYLNVASKMAPGNQSITDLQSCVKKQ
jgi:tetratricopeptide (TPR) repeat protein